MTFNTDYAIVCLIKDQLTLTKRKIMTATTKINKDSEGYLVKLFIDGVRQEDAGGYIPVDEGFTKEQKREAKHKANEYARELRKTFTDKAI